jgi:hypothetical protein
MPQWLRANLLILGLLCLTAAFLFLAHLFSLALGLFPEERRYVLATVAVIAFIVNAVIARRVHTRLTRIDLRKHWPG